MKSAVDIRSRVEARLAARAGIARRVRERAHLSQAELATALGVSQAALSRWEAGLRQPRGEIAERYARELRKLARLTRAETPRLSAETTAKRAR
jgi:transcriptional regulator with XRE-family HTH domain